MRRLDHRVFIRLRFKKICGKIINGRCDKSMGSGIDNFLLDKRKFPDGNAKLHPGAGALEHVSQGYVYETGGCGAKGKSPVVKDGQSDLVTFARFAEHIFYRDMNILKLNGGRRASLYAHLWHVF